MSVIRPTLFHCNTSPATPESTIDNGCEDLAALKKENCDKSSAKDVLIARLKAGRISGEQKGWIPAEEVRERFAKRAAKFD